jgi:hypothetical protein
VAGGEHEERGKVVFLVLTKRFLTFAYVNYMNVKTPKFSRPIFAPSLEVQARFIGVRQKADARRKRIVHPDGHLDVH